ncbi:MAG: hypothetical protein M1549_02255 [Candidatus Dependentiae bacterium]|nr:hypothetical protein [Candidatus Dependentiae bacterium]
MRSNFWHTTTLGLLCTCAPSILSGMGKTETEKSKERLQIAEMVKNACQKVHARALLKKRQLQQQAREQNRLLKSSSREQIKAAVAGIFENLQKRHGVTYCPICQEPIGKYPCTTLHKSAGGGIPHQFCTHCLYTWCQKTYPEHFGVDGSRETIAIACPLCQERNEEGEKDKNGDYPLQTFSLDLPTLKKGFYDYTKKNLSLADRLADLEQLPQTLVTETLTEYANLSPEERKSAVEDPEDMAIQLQRYGIEQCNRFYEDGPTGTTDDEPLDAAIAGNNTERQTIAELILRTVDGHHPLRSDFIAAIFDLLPSDKRLSYFERAINGCSTISDEDVIAEKEDLSAYLHIDIPPSLQCTQDPDGDPGNSAKIELFIKDARYFEQCGLHAACLPFLPAEIQKKAYAELLKLEPPRVVVKKKGLGKVFIRLASDVQISYFDDVYDYLTGDKKLAVLIKLRDSLIKKYGVASTLDKLNRCGVTSQGAIEAYWPIMSSSERLSYFSRFLTSCIACYSDETGTEQAAACIESLISKIPTDEQAAYFDAISSFINSCCNNNKLQIERCRRIFGRLAATAKPTLIIPLYRQIQKKLDANRPNITREQIFNAVLPLIKDDPTRGELATATMELFAKASEKEGLLQNAWEKFSPTLRTELFESYFGTQKDTEKLALLKKFRQQVPAPTWEKCLMATLHDDPTYEIITETWDVIPIHSYARAFEKFFTPHYPLLANVKIPLIERLRKTLPLDLYHNLRLATKKKARLAVLTSAWEKLPKKQYRDGLIFALSMISASYREIFAITRPDEWLADCSLDEKADLLWTLWNAYPQHRLESYFTIFKHCDPVGKKALQAGYVSRLQSLKRQRPLATIHRLTLPSGEIHRALPTYHEW